MNDFQIVFEQILDGAFDDAAATGLLTQWADEGETVEQIVSAARILRRRALPAGSFPDAVDVCGTGGDGAGSVNISTAAALVAAACGVAVAKHGNRAASSQSGSTDVLQALGIEVQSTAAEAIDHMGRHGIAFLAAPAFHPALARVALLRRAIGRRTIFNLLGPLANPAGVRRQLLGVSTPALVPVFAAALKELGTTTAWVVHGDGMDEIAVSGETRVAYLRNGTIADIVMKPSDFDLASWPKAALQGGTAEYNARALEMMLAGEAGAYKDVVCLNAGAALLVAEKVRTFPEGIELARTSIESGATLDLLQRLRHKAT